MKFHHILLAGVAAAAMTSAAQAADLIIDQPPVYSAPVVSAYDWSGAYVGLNAGYATGDFDWTADYYLNDTFTDGTDGSFDVSGWTLGLNAGANVQFNSFVLGVEGDVDWVDISGEGTVDEIGSTSDVVASLDWMASLRGKAGFAVDRMMIYGTAGLAWAGGEFTVTDFDTAGDDRTFDSNATGWTAGAGLEYAIDDNISLKAEYRYTALTMDEIEEDNVPPADYVLLNGDSGIHTVKAGVNFRF